MIKFLLKGLLHDRSRSLLPIIVVSLGVMLTVFLHCWIYGIIGDSIRMSANFDTGHLKVMTRAYAEKSEQMPNDLAILGADKLVQQLQKDHPDMDWVQRIRFGALMDFPDDKGETRAQGPVAGWALDLLTPGSKEAERFNLEKSIVSGRMPSKPGEALITDDFAVKFKIKPGDKFTLFGTTMEGSMAFRNFTVSGTVRFGVGAIDKGAVITDISDAQQTFAMDDAAGEILGFFSDGNYDLEKAASIAHQFNASYESSKDEYAPVMLTLRDQEGMAEMLDYIDAASGIMIFAFLLAMSLVLWNAGLLGGLRRYNEFGVRLAMGESKSHIFNTLVYEGILIGIIGTIIGTAVGLAFSYLVHYVGLNTGGMMKNASIMIPVVVRTEVTPTAYFIGFVPGLLSVVLGNVLAGIGIYKRQTANLFKELEV
ncbi:MAG TPA: ABC transporter permease [Bacteroidales bacterium]|nr:ABC transporter permease [Bacteroidales bacterium]HQN17290.1 ABC transporter permease [Bacteroidales bacterium]HQP16612.1 ABC transporter permease [Bacteroidales bacterium]